MGKARQKQYCYDYPRPAVTVDVVVVTGEEDPRVLLIRRKQEPFIGSWAIPGGFVEMDETLEAGARRELREETGIQVGVLKQLHTFGDPGRDPRGRTIAVVYLVQVDADRLEVRAGDDAAEAGWHLLRQPPPLAFDHDQILACARQRLAGDSVERGRGNRAPR
jgi:8-oxo-dGTP diphosphatase